ncbi:MAG TPA: DUF2155 domain-containing protein [Acetobacteraceae bacterium]|jgi:hypothetical protein|nr:DUF2155 domain-containing protein [Acetobacteraceae bacterium]
MKALSLFAFSVLVAATQPGFAADHVTLDIGGKTTVAKPAYVEPPRHLTVDDAIPGKDGIKRMVILRGLDKMTARATNIYAPVGVPVKFATLVITARYCYSTPITETPETTAFLQVVDHRPDQPERKVFSGWMLASSPSLNGVEHPLYDVWVMSCRTNLPGQQAPTVASTTPVKPTSPDASANEKLPELPEGAEQ